MDPASPPRAKATLGKQKLPMRLIGDKTRRGVTFSKRKNGLLKKAYELTRLTGTQALLLIASETGQVYTFATPRLQPVLNSDATREHIQRCLNDGDGDDDGGRGDGRIGKRGRGREVESKAGKGGKGKGRVVSIHDNALFELSTRRVESGDEELGGDEGGAAGDGGAGGDVENTNDEMEDDTANGNDEMEDDSPNEDTEEIEYKQEQDEEDDDPIYDETTEQVGDDDDPQPDHSSNAENDNENNDNNDDEYPRDPTPVISDDHGAGDLKPDPLALPTITETILGDDDDDGRGGAGFAEACEASLSPAAGVKVKAAERAGIPAHAAAAVRPPAGLAQFGGYPPPAFGPYPFAQMQQPFNPQHFTAAAHPPPPPPHPFIPASQLPWTHPPPPPFPPPPHPFPHPFYPPFLPPAQQPPTTTTTPPLQWKYQHYANQLGVIGPYRPRQHVLGPEKARPKQRVLKPKVGMDVERMVGMGVAALRPEGAGGSGQREGGQRGRKRRRVEDGEDGDGEEVVVVVKSEPPEDG